MKDFNKALNYSFLLLKYRPRSKCEIISRLKKKGCNQPLIEKVVSYLEENNYINDKNFTHLFITSSLEKNWGPLKIDFHLRRLGICCELRKQTLKGISYSDKIKNIAKEKFAYYLKQKPSLPKDAIWQRVIRALAAKGFDYQDILSEMDRLREDYEDSAAT